MFVQPALQNPLLQFARAKKRWQIQLKRANKATRGSVQREALCNNFRRCGARRKQLELVGEKKPSECVSAIPASRPDAPVAYLAHPADSARRACCAADYSNCSVHRRSALTHTLFCVSGEAAGRGRKNALAARDKRPQTHNGLFSDCTYALLSWLTYTTTTHLTHSSPKMANAARARNWPGPGCRSPLLLFIPAGPAQNARHKLGALMTLDFARHLRARLG